MPLIGILMSRIDARRLVMGGFLLGGLSLFWLARINLQAGFWIFSGRSLFRGSG